VAVEPGREVAQQLSFVALAQHADLVGQPAQESRRPARGRPLKTEPEMMRLSPGFSRPAVRSSRLAPTRVRTRQGSSTCGPPSATMRSLCSRPVVNNRPKAITSW
jgi:hypothetical protein